MKSNVIHGGVHKGKDAIYYRGRTMDVLQCFRSDELGFYSYDGDVSEVPLDTSPISVTLVDDRLWTRRRTKTAPSITQQNVLPGHIVQDTLPRAPLHNVTVGCDGISPSKRPSCSSGVAD